MQEFKVGDKVLVEAEIEKIDTSSWLPYRLSRGDKKFMTDRVYPIPTKTYEDGMAEAWETARRLMMLEKDGGLSLEEASEIFGFGSFHEIFKNFTAIEAAARIAEWEAEEICVGDVVNIIVGKYEGVVSKVKGEGCYVIFGDGSSRKFRKDDLVKTGRIIDIAGLLAEIGGVE